MGRITSNVQYHSWITVIDMFPNSYYRGFWMSPTYQVKHIEGYEDVSWIVLIIWYCLDTTHCFLLCKAHKEFALSCVYLQLRYKCNSKSTGSAAGFQGLWLHSFLDSWKPNLHCFLDSWKPNLKDTRSGWEYNWSVVMESFWRWVKLIGNSRRGSHLILLVFLDWHKEGDVC